MMALAPIRWRTTVELVEKVELVGEFRVDEGIGLIRRPRNLEIVDENRPIGVDDRRDMPAGRSLAQKPRTAIFF